MQILSIAETADHTQWKHQQLDHTWRKLLSDLFLWCTDSVQTRRDNSLGQDLPKGTDQEDIRTKLFVFAVQGISQVVAVRASRQNNNNKKILPRFRLG